MALEFDPLDILHDKTKKEIVEQLLKKNGNESCIYFQHEKDGFKLKRSIQMRFSNSRPGEQVYEIVDDGYTAHTLKQKPPKGSSGSFRYILATIRVRPSFKVKVYPKAFERGAKKEGWGDWVEESEKPRGIKIFNEKISLKHVIAESKNGRDSPMKSKYPSLYADSNYSIVMHDLGDMTLYDLIYHKKIKLTSLEIFELFVSLLKIHWQEFINKDCIHGDIKPKNILVNAPPKAMRAWLVDYGFVKSINKHSKYITGTEEYLAPELRLGAVNDSKTDLYSLGLALLELLAQGRHTRFCMSSYSCHKNYLIHLIKMLNPLVSEIKLMFAGELKEAVIELLSALLKKDPEERLDPSMFEKQVSFIEQSLKKVKRNNKNYEIARDKEIDKNLKERLSLLLDPYILKKRQASFFQLQDNFLGEFALKTKKQLLTHNSTYRKLEDFLEIGLEAALQKISGKNHLELRELRQMIKTSIHDVFYSLLNPAIMKEYQSICSMDVGESQAPNPTQSIGN